MDSNLTNTPDPKGAKNAADTAHQAKNKTLLLDRREMAERLGISTRSLDRLIASKLVPVVRIGRLVKLREDAVLAAIERNLEVQAA